MPWRAHPCRRHASAARPEPTEVSGPTEPARSLPCLPGLPWRRKSADLLQQAKGVGVIPAFGNPAACIAEDDHARDRETLAAWWNAPKFTLVGACTCKAGHDPISLGDLVLNAEPHIGEGTVKVRVELLVSF